MRFNFKNEGIQTKYKYLLYFFEKTYKEYCRGHYHDDRRLFINMYRQLIRMLLVADSIYGKSSTLDVAIGEKFRAKTEELKEIQERFEMLANLKII